MAQRILSAVALLPLTIIFVWWNVWAVVAVVAALTVLALLELYGAFTRGGYHPRVGVGVGIGLALIAAVALRSVLPLDLIPIVLTLAIVISLIIELSRHSHEGALPSWALTLAGALYIGWLFSHLIMLRNLGTRVAPLAPLDQLRIDSGAAWVYFVLAITWLQDTAAYFAGRQFGRHKMAPTLSPKKTWEGAVGGLLGAVIGAVLCILLFGLPISLWLGVVLGLVGGVVGPLGDLAESLIKRQVGLKDAGHLIPGHGGILDRTDSLLFTAPVLFYLIRLAVGLY